MNNWKEKRIGAINRLSRIKRWSCSPDNPYFDEVQDIYKSENTSLKGYKLERKKHEEVNTFNVIRNKLCV